jgi:hypothetical protein
MSLSLWRLPKAERFALRLERELEAVLNSDTRSLMRGVMLSSDAFPAATVVSAVTKNIICVTVSE